MITENHIQKGNDGHYLTDSEKAEIDQRIHIETAKIACGMSTIGGTTNIVSGLFVLWVLFSKISLGVLVSWYAILVLANTVNIIAAFYFKDLLKDPRMIQIWRKLVIGIFVVICLTWGSMPIIFITPDTNYQLYVLAFLLAVVIGFSFPSLTDFTLAILSICCLLVPAIFFYLFRGLHTFGTTVNSTNISFGISMSLLILGTFLLIASRIGSRLVTRFFQLSFTNAALSFKLENMNKLLEQRVQERTIDLEKSLKQVTFQATHDLLTNLPNLRSLVKYMKKSIKLSQENEHLFAVIFFSINEIDRIYNALGHQIGDSIIKTVAQRFQELYPEPTNDNIQDHDYIVTLSRKDVFVIIMKPIYSYDDVEARVESLFKILEKPVYTEKQIIKLTTSIGVSLFPRNGRDITSLLMNADAAMLVAKQAGGNSLKMYKSEINAAISKQLEMESSLHTALLKTEFILQYQPFIDLKTGLISGVEALVRWENPTLGRIPPDRFIPLAEANGIIIPLGEWVLRTACAQTKMWHQEGFSSLKIAINLSAKQLHSKFIIQSINNLLKEINLDPNYIELELTESVAFQEEILPTLKELKSMGFNLSIDDFGTGYSSMSNLKLITVDKIKIDKSFVQDIVTNSESRAIVTNTISLAKKINATVVAEGVETKDQLDFLILNECDVVQGFYFSPPVDPNVLGELLKENIKFIPDAN